LCNRHELVHIHCSSAETHANADGIIQGLLDTELSNIGYLQSQAVGRYLEYHRFSHIYSSDLKRASEVSVNCM
jgi:broad specificity phosphatase PhoE